MDLVYSAPKEFVEFGGELNQMSFDLIESLPMFKEALPVSNYQRGSISKFVGIDERVILNESDFNSAFGAKSYLIYFPFWDWKSTVSMLDQTHEKYPLSPLYLSSSLKLFGDRLQMLLESDTLNPTSKLIDFISNFPYISNEFKIAYNTKISFVDILRFKAIDPTSLRDIEINTLTRYEHKFVLLDPFEKHVSGERYLHIPSLENKNVSNHLSVVHRNEGFGFVMLDTSPHFQDILEFIQSIYILSRQILDDVLVIGNTIDISYPNLKEHDYRKTILSYLGIYFKALDKHTATFSSKLIPCMLDLMHKMKKKNVQ